MPFAAPLTPGRGQQLNLIEVAAELVKDRPITPAQILELDRWWLHFIYWHPREDGQLIVSPKIQAHREDMSDLGQFKTMGRAQRWPDWYAAVRCAAWQQSQADERAARGG